MGPGVLGCDGKCYPQGVTGKEVDCMGVRPQNMFRGVLRCVLGVSGRIFFRAAGCPR